MGKTPPPPKVPRPQAADSSDSPRPPALIAAAVLSDLYITARELPSPGERTWNTRRLLKKGPQHRGVLAALAFVGGGTVPHCGDSSIRQERHPLVTDGLVLAAYTAFYLLLPA
jgi:hypothetical protein